MAGWFPPAPRSLAGPGRPARPRAAALPAAVLVVLIGMAVTPGCGREPGLVVSGRLQADVFTVSVPDLPSPSLDLNAGFPTQPEARGRDAASARTSPAGSTDGSTQPGTGPSTPVVGSDFTVVTAIRAAEGSWVRAGQPLATLDDRALSAAVNMARAEAQLARAHIAVVDEALERAADARRDLTAARADVLGVIGGLRQGRARLAARVTQARDLRRRLTRHPPNTPGIPTLLPTPTSSPNPPYLPNAPNQVNHPVPPPRQLETIIGRLTDAIGDLDRGLARARTRLAGVDRGLARVAERRAELGRVRTLTRVAADGADLGVRVAELHRSLATVVAPVAGVLETNTTPGSVLAGGAGLATIRGTNPPRAVAWLPPDEASRLCVGDAAWVRGDWMAEGQRLPGRVGLIAARAEYPPTSQATDAIHLTRAVRVEVRLEPTRAGLAPPGLPVDIGLTECRRGE